MNLWSEQSVSVKEKLIDWYLVGATRIKHELMVWTEGLCLREVDWLIPGRRCMYHTWTYGLNRGVSVKEKLIDWYLVGTARITHELMVWTEGSLLKRSWLIDTWYALHVSHLNLWSEQRGLVKEKLIDWYLVGAARITLELIVWTEGLCWREVAQAARDGSVLHRKTGLLLWNECNKRIGGLIWPWKFL